MQSIKTLLILIILSFTACRGPVERESSVSNSYPELSSNLDQYFTALTGIDQFNGGVLVKKGDEVVIYKAFNMQDGDHPMYVTEDSQFDIHSISKLMGKASIVNLNEIDLVNPESPLSTYIPDFPNGDIITIQHLLDNQSGLPRELSNKPDNLIDYSPQEVVDLIKEEELLYTPGTETLYSNMGYQLVYYVIAKVTGRPFVQYVDEEFFTPLSMTKSGAHFHLDKDNLENLMTNHVIDDEELVAVPNYFPDGKNQAKIYSTLGDLMRFIQHMREDKYQSQLINKAGSIGWSGGGDGIRTHATAYLESDYDLVFFANYDEIPFQKILDDVNKIMDNQSFEMPKEIKKVAVKVEKAVMQRYVGKYDMAEFNHHEFEVRVEGEDFVFYQNGERNTELSAENDSTFFYDPKSSDSFTFRKGDSEEYELIFNWKGVDIVGKKK